MAARRQLGRVRRLVVKVGTSLIAEPGTGPDPDRIAALAAEIAGAREGRETVLGTSGAIATGMARLALPPRPRSIPEKQAAAAVGQAAPLVWEGAGPGAVGGRATKLQAAHKAAAAGVPMVIASGRKQGVLARVLKGEPVGTYFAPKADRLGARKRWIAFAVTPQGRLMVDAGARQALTHHGKSLLPSGVVDVEGDFAAGEGVALVGEGRGFARGVVHIQPGGR